MRVLDAVIDLIKVRDELRMTEDKLRHFRRVVDGSVNDIMDWMKEQNLLAVKEHDASKADSSELEQPVVEGSRTQGEIGVGTDSEYEEWDEIQDGPGS